MAFGLLAFLISLPSGWAYFVSCEEGWYGFSESTSCYFLAHRHAESWKDAKEVCERYDAHLLIVDTVAEKVRKR